MGLPSRTLRLADLQQRDGCPGCGSHATVGSRAIRFRKFEDFAIGRVEIGPDVLRERKLLKCQGCSLCYVSHVLTERAMQELTEIPGSHVRWQGATRPGYDRSRAAIEQLPGRIRVMDVGANVGLFLDSLGTDIDKTALEANAASCLEMENRGLQVISGTAESVELPAASFDVVTALDVLEHFYRPDQAVQAIARTLKPDGIFVFETGTTDCAGASLLKDAWYYCTYLEHFQVFDAASLHSLLSASGFERVTLRKVYHDRARFSPFAHALMRTAAFLLTTRFTHDPDAWIRFCRRFNSAALGSPPTTGLFEPDHVFGIYRRTGTK